MKSPAFGGLMEDVLKREQRDSSIPGCKIAPGEGRHACYLWVLGRLSTLVSEEGTDPEMEGGREERRLRTAEELLIWRTEGLGQPWHYP